MANINVYTVYDRVAECYSLPQTSTTDGAMLRVLKGTCARNDANLGDYALYKIGEFDNEKGVLIASSLPTQVAMNTDREVL